MENHLSVSATRALSPFHKGSEVNHAPSPPISNLTRSTLHLLDFKPIEDCGTTKNETGQEYDGDFKSHIVDLEDSSLERHEIKVTPLNSRFMNTPLSTPTAIQLETIPDLLVVSAGEFQE